MITINEIVMDHVVRKIADRIYWVMNKPLDVTKEDIDTLVNFYYDDEIVQLIRNDISSYTKIMEKLKEWNETYG